MSVFSAFGIAPGYAYAGLAALILVVLVLGWEHWLRLLGVVFIADDELGEVYKKFVVAGGHRTLPQGKIVALQGEAGLQADTLAPGIHYGFWPWQYDVEKVGFTEVPGDKIGIVEARDGAPLSAGRILGQHVECDAFQNARAFLDNGGQRGPQMSFIPPGTYRINKGLFTIKFAEVTDIEDNKIGIVTTTEGEPLPTGEIAGAEVPGHRMFQDADAFVAHGGHKGLQTQVLLAGRYFINPMFAQIELKELTIVPIAHVGVVIAYVGAAGNDVTGESFKHGNLVSVGERGVCVTPMPPGKYPVNPYTHKVELVPTANVVLNWADAKTEAHKLDANLSTITVRSSDGFKFNLDVSQIIHIPHTEAPKVIARFGSMQNLVTQVLEPTIGNYFRNAAQGSDAISFLKERKERQDEARSCIFKALADYNVNAVDTLIGDIVPPDALMKPLTDRKIAEQEQQTFAVQEIAEKTRQSLEQARAIASTQASVVDKQRRVEMAKFDAEAAVNAARGQAEAKTLNAQADADVTRLNGAAEAGKVLAIGEAEATVIQKKTDALDAGNYAVIEVARALSESGQKLVPDMVSGGGSGGDAGGSLVNLLLMQTLKGANGHNAPK